MMIPLKHQQWYLMTVMTMMTVWMTTVVAAAARRYEKFREDVMSQQKIDVCVLPMSLSPAIKADVIWLWSKCLSLFHSSWLNSQFLAFKLDTIHLVNCILSIMMILKLLFINQNS